MIYPIPIQHTKTVIKRHQDRSDQILIETKLSKEEVISKLKKLFPKLKEENNYLIDEDIPNPILLTIIAFFTSVISTLITWMTFYYFKFHFTLYFIFIGIFIIVYLLSRFIGNDKTKLFLIDEEDNKTNVLIYVYDSDGYRNINELGLKKIIEVLK